jgi:hypothetical protein
MKVVRVERTEQDYYLVFTIFFVILSIIAILLSVAIPLILRKRQLPSELTCSNISADNNSEIMIYNRDTPFFGKYYIDPDTLSMTLFRPVKTFLYRDGYLYNSDRTKVLTLKKTPDFFFVNVVNISFESINPSPDENMTQKWILSGSVISTEDLKYKLTVTEKLRLQVIFYGANNETSCNWIFEKV